MRRTCSSLSCRLLAAAALAALTACKRGQPIDPAPPPPAQARAVADAYGYAAWPNIERLDFTFNQTGPTGQLQRRWTWEPVSGWVTLHGDARGGSVSFLLAAMASDPARITDEVRQAYDWFVHDSTMLLLPFHLEWASRQVVVHDPSQPLPPPPEMPVGLLGGDRPTLITLRTRPIGLAGQSYDLYIRQDHRVIGSRAQGAKLMTWHEHASVGPLLLSLERRSADGATTVRFSDVRVKLRGQDRLLAPQR